MQDKIESLLEKLVCGKAHFKELAKASSSRIELHCTSILAEFINIAMAKKCNFIINHFKNYLL